MIIVIIFVPVNLGKGVYTPQATRHNITREAPKKADPRPQQASLSRVEPAAVFYWLQR